MSRHAAKIPIKLRTRIYKRDGYCCVYCQSPNLLTIDHIIPRSKGGTSKEENLATACMYCNSYKAGRTPEEWRA